METANMSTTARSDRLAEAIESCLISPNTYDGNGEAANIVDATDSIAQAIRHGLKWLGTGDALTSMGAIEAHGAMVKEAAGSIAAAIHDLADAIREMNER
jgi:hypothetical protein